MGEAYDLFTSYYFIAKKKPVLVLKSRNRFGERRTHYINDFKPYYYVSESEVLNSVCSYEKAIDGTKVCKIITNLPGDVKLQRQQYSKTFESDIPFNQRYLIDNGIYCGYKKEGEDFVSTESLGVKPRMLSLDIEVQAIEGVPDSKEAKEPIFVIGCYDTYKEDLIQFVPDSLDDESQARILKEFFAYVKERDFDLIIGWNPLFDVNFIISKAENLYVRYDNTFGRVNRGERWIDIAGMELFDLLPAYKKYFQQTKFDSYSLEAVYKKEFDKELMQYDYNTTGFDQIDLICEANATHVMACIEIDEKHHLVGLFDQIRRLCGCTYRQALTTVYFTDLALLRRAHGKFVSPQRPEVEGEKYKFEGGYVMQPEKGVFKNVVVLDFKKHYPVAMISYNMSPETVSEVPIEDAYEVDGVWFKKEPVGIVPQMLIDFIEARNEVKEEMRSLDPESEEYQRMFAQQYALKQMVDATYGVQDHAAFRYYQPLIPKSTTFLGRKWVKRAIGLVEALGYRVIYVDTDSAMFEGGEDWKRVGKEIQDKVNEDFRQMAKESDLKATPEVDFELAYSAILFKQKSSSIKKRRRSKKKDEAAKKRHAGVVVYEGGKDVDYLKVRGMEIRRSDSALVTREIQKELLRLILYGASRNEIKEFLRSQAERFRELPLEEFGIPRKMGMGIGEYSNPATVRSVTYANEYLGEEIKKGQRCYDILVKRILDPSLPQKIEIVVKGKAKMYPVDRISLTRKVPEGITIDWDAQIRKIFRDKMESILDSAGIEWDEVFNYHKSTTLGEWGA